MKNQFKIFANYGVLGREKRVVYSYYTPITEASDEIIVSFQKMIFLVCTKISLEI